MTANSDYFDAAIRHQIGIRNFTSGEVKRVLALLEKADRELVTKLRERLTKMRGEIDFTSERYAALVRDMRILRAEAMKAVRQELSPTLFELTKMEVAFEEKLLANAIPIEVGFTAVSAQQLRAIVTKRPFQGRLLREWYTSLAREDQRNLVDALQQGLSQGESIPSIVRRVAGTRANAFRDGALAITRRSAESVVRTAVNHVTNGAREEVWKENSDIIDGLRWSAVLDGRTSRVCSARDGKVAPVEGKPIPKGFEKLDPPGARPPAHVNCRSMMTAIIDGVGVLGKQPTITDTRNRRRREIDFRKEARRRGVPIQQVRNEWAEANIGSAPSALTYDEWLRTQSREFQNEVLGPTKAKLFRDGEKLDRFVDRRGNELTLEQLRRTLDF